MLSLLHSGDDIENDRYRPISNHTLKICCCTAWWNRIVFQK